MISGIDIQLLDGVDTAENEHTQLLIAQALKGYDRNTIDNIDTLINGYDLAGFAGDGSIEDEEKVRSFLIRTKVVADKYPQSVNGYQNPEQFSKMLGYVLQNWDNANRERALQNMVSEEARLIGLGAIKTDLAEDDDDVELVGVDEEIDEDDQEVIGSVATADGTVKKVVKTKKGKGGFFKNVQKLLNNPNISKEANAVVNSNTLLDKVKNTARRKTAQSRQRKKTLVTNKATKQAKVISQDVATNVSGLSGFDDDIQMVLNGADFIEGLNGMEDNAIKNYLQRTKKVLEKNNNDLFNSQNQENVVLGALEYALKNIDNDEASEVVLHNLSGVGMTNDEYDEFIRGLGEAVKQSKKRKFFSALKKVQKNPTTANVKAVAKANVFVKPAQKSLAKKVAERLVAKQVDSVQSQTLGGIDGNTAVKNILNTTISTIKSNPKNFVDDQYEYENVLGVLGYALQHFANPEVQDKLCGKSMTFEQYDNMEDQLGAVVAKKAITVKKAEKANRKRNSKLSELLKAYRSAPKNSEEKKKLAEKLAEASKNAQMKGLFGALGKTKLKDKIKKAVKKVAKVATKVATAPVKAAVKATKAVTKATVKATKAVAKTTAKVAKKVGKAVAKAVKKVVKFVIKYNPITLVARSIILMACQLNMFKMAERIYPALVSEEEATKLGLTAEQYKASKDAYEKLKKGFTKMGGKESKLQKYLEKGSKKVWKGGDTFDTNELKSQALKNQKNIDTMVNEDEAELKKQGAVSSDDPNVTYSETEETVEVPVDEAQEVAVSGLLGLIDNGYLTVDGLGLIATATVASGTASASGVLASILATLKKIFASGKVKEAVKKVAKNVATKTKNAVVNAKQKTVEAVKNVATTTKEKVSDTINNAKDRVKDIASSSSAQKIKDTAKNVVTSAASNFFNKYNATEPSVPTTQTTEKKPNVGLIIGIGVGAVALVGTAIYLGTRNRDNKD